MEPRSVSLSEGALFRKVGDEAVILDVATEKYFGLDRVGGAMVELIAEGDGPVSEADVVLDISGRFSAPAERIEQDVQVLVDKLVSLGLAQISNPSDSALLKHS